jgi:hypothetical protein
VFTSLVDLDNGDTVADLQAGDVDGMVAFLDR